MTRPAQRDLPDGAGWRYDFADSGVGIAVRPQGSPHGRVLAELLVTAGGEPGAPVGAPAVVDLLDPRARSGLAADLARLGQARIDWRTLVEAAVLAALVRMRGVAAIVPRTLTAAEVLAQSLPAPRDVVPGLITEGAHLLGGAPKAGKSWLALGLVVAVAAGGMALGHIPVEGGEALYLALEDHWRRLQQRLRALLRGDEAAPSGLHFSTSWPRLDAGGIEALDGWLEGHPRARLVAIDTLARARGRSQQRPAAHLYDDDYATLEGLTDLAGRRKVAVLVLHHLRKGAFGADPLEQLSGTMGLVGAADGALILDRRRGADAATLHIHGRDLLEGKALALHWDAPTAAWELVGDADDVAMREERARILEVLTAAGEPLGPKDIAEVAEHPYGATRRLLWAMVTSGQVDRVGYGKYIPGRNGAAEITAITAITESEPWWDR